MPRKNSVKLYYENAFYHVYNRGVEKRKIFLDNEDYSFYLHLLKGALLPPETGLNPAENPAEINGTPIQPLKRIRKNFYQDIELHSYSLIPNHYHFILKQIKNDAVTEFIRSVCTSYSMYFNKKYNRVGSLFQGIFRAKNITNDNYLIWLSRYIHRNPEDYQNYPYSSYADFLGKRKTEWVNTSFILDCFKSQNIPCEESYKEFVESENEDDSPIDISDLYLE